MKKRSPLNRLLETLNDILDGILQFACLACQAVPWLHAALSRPFLR